MDAENLADGAKDRLEEVPDGLGDEVEEVAGVDEGQARADEARDGQEGKLELWRRDESVDAVLKERGLRGC